MEPYLSFADLHQIEGVGNRVPSHRGVFDSRAIEKFKAHSSVNCHINRGSFEVKWQLLCYSYAD